MKLLVFTHAFGAAAEQRFYAELEQATGWSVTVVVPLRSRAQHGEDDTTPRWPGLRAQVRRLEVIRPGDRTPLLYRSGLVELLREQMADAIYVQHEPQSPATVQIYAANWLSGERPIGFYTLQNAPSRDPAPIRAIEQMVIRSSAFAFAASERGLEVLRAKHFRGPAAAMPAALDLESFRPDPTRGAARRAAMRLKPGDTLFGYVGELDEKRGLSGLLSAFERLEGVEWQLFMVGSGRLENALRAKILASNQLRGRVHFTGQVAHDEVFSWLSLLDAVVLPSEPRGSSQEPSGRVLLEALACGTPGIGADVGEIAAVARQTGGALLFQQGDASSLAAALRRMAQEPELRRQLALTGGAAVADQFCQDELIERFAAVIRSGVHGTAAHRQQANQADRALSG